MATSSSPRPILTDSVAATPALSTTPYELHGVIRFRLRPEDQAKGGRFDSQSGLINTPGRYLLGGLNNPMDRTPGLSAFDEYLVTDSHLVARAVLHDVLYRILGVNILGSFLLSLLSIWLVDRFTLALP